MIIIDGREAELTLSSFENLQEVLVKAMEEDSLKDHIVTDILVNEKPFSEIYPYQAEDIETTEIERLEIQTIHVTEMALSITEELGKVNTLLVAGASEIANLFRQADDSEALELLQDLLDVTRNFLGIVSLLRNEYVGIEENIPNFSDNVENISNLLGEMTEVMENEDWILLSDLLEYEFLPIMKNWGETTAYIQNNISKL